MSWGSVNCRTDNSLAQEQVTAENKERVLKALGEAAAKLHSKLGESLSTVQKFDTPVEQATTPSHPEASQGGVREACAEQRVVQEG